MCVYEMDTSTYFLSYAHQQAEWVEYWLVVGSVPSLHLRERDGGGGGGGGADRQTESQSDSDWMTDRLTD